MSGIVLGIDLGTTNSVVAVSDGGQSRVIPGPDGRRLWPSVVAFPPTNEVLVGPAARERRLIDAPNTIYSIKRLIGLPYESEEVARARKRLPFALQSGDSGRVVVRARHNKEYTLPEISAFVLRDLRRIAEEQIGERCERAVVTVPANFNELQRSATKAAGMIAGIEVIRILNEPTAAALAYGYQQRKPERIAVYDLGGGTFDVSILELDQDAFEVVGTAGDAFLGGDDIDVVVAEAMADAFLERHRIDPRTSVQQFERLRAAAEWVKCRLSAEPETNARVEELAHGERGAPLALDFHMTRADLEARAKPLVDKSLAVCKQALDAAGLRPRDIQSVILVGGATRMPLVRKMVRDFFRRQPRTDIDPDLVVAIGAGILGHTLSGRPDVAPGPGGLARKQPLAKLRRPDLARLLPREPEVPIPVQPAFAPSEQTEAGLPKPPAKKVPRPTPPPPALPLLPDPGLVRPKTIEPKPLVGTRDGSSAFSLADLEKEEQAALRRAEEKAKRAAALFGRLEPETGAAGAPIAETPFGGKPSPVSPPAGAPAAAKPAAPAAPPPGALAQADAPLAPPTGFYVPKAGARPAGPAEPNRPAADPKAPATFSRGGSQPRFPAVAEPARPPPAPVESTPRLGAALFDDSELDLEVERAAAERAQPATDDLAFFLPDAGSAASEDILFVEDPPERGAPAAPAPAAAPPPSGELPAVLFDDADLEPSVPPPAPVIDLPAGPAPLLMDVTPHSLGIEMAGGSCSQLLRRNVPIPAEQARLFTTARDEQDAVVVRICQGESRIFRENQLLGEIELTGLRRAPRGEPKIQVSFIIDASGVLESTAVDLDTGRAQTIRVNLLGGYAQDEIDALRRKHEQAWSGGGGA